MIHIVSPDNEYLYKDEMEQAYRLRHRVFVEEKKWTDLSKPDGREVDQFDNEHAVHMLYIEEGKVLGYQRMLPSTRPHLLSDVLPHLCEDVPPVGEHIWEWTRYCVEPAHRERGRTLSPVANMLLSGIVEWGLESGVNTIIIQMNPLWLLRLVQLHFRVMPLGLPQRVGDEDVVAVTASFDRRTLARLQDMRGNRQRVLAEPESFTRRLAS
ncbi:acyl-homoserine-lactone synthase [Microvirga sp. CF3016]|uniref:acyl-homoserine-lactone synthase n=1 Tax=Microvirga sp. CF3016 TaxID=3110181 RepID=UPI002E7A165C|nr:acyl-homoserine-lactone synthase [Microvirga sp. CF3016]MEE1613337.1 acyl-homoserine-lactone synthase [Microvirga sp. CF3016]